MGRLEVYLAPEVEELLLECSPQREVFGHLELAGVEGNFEGSYKVSFRYAVLAASCVEHLVAAGYGDSLEAEALLFEEVADGGSHAGVIHDESRRFLRSAPHQAVGFRKALISHQRSNAVSHVGVERA
jgi:hypothetical protein